MTTEAEVREVIRKDGEYFGLTGKDLVDYSRDSFMLTGQEQNGQFIVIGAVEIICWFSSVSGVGT